MEKIQKFNKLRAFNKAVGPGKKTKLINVGPSSIPKARVGRCFFPENLIRFAARLLGRSEYLDRTSKMDIPLCKYEFIFAALH